MAENSSSSAASSNNQPKPSTSSSDAKIEDGNDDLPLCIVVLGMAGSGKTTFVYKLTEYLYRSRETTPYVINLDPAVRDVNYPCNIDIRDTVKYKNVMKEYNMGPNGAILTSLNLFSSRFDQVLHLLDKRKKETKYVIVDTPGQIEVFTWSASGTIITESLASQFPVVVAYVMDSERNQSPTTFMSNMLYACSILYKTKLPFIIVLNKSDLAPPDFAIEWMKDWEKFQEALNKQDTYSSGLSRSLSLVLDEFYADLNSVPFSAKTGRGLPELMEALARAKEEYNTDYKPEYEKLKVKKREAELEEQERKLSQVKLDIAMDRNENPEMYTRSQFLAEKRTHINIGGAFHEADEDADMKQTNSDDDEQKEDEEEKAEYESFKRFLKDPKAKNIEIAAGSTEGGKSSSETKK